MTQFSPADLAADELAAIEWFEQGVNGQDVLAGASLNLVGGPANPVAFTVIGANDGFGILVVAAQGTVKAGGVNGGTAKLEYQLDGSGVWYEAGRIFLNVAGSHQSLAALRLFRLAAGAHTIQFRLTAVGQTVTFDANCFIGFSVFEV